jgi:hypothetical protein
VGFLWGTARASGLVGSLWAIRKASLARSGISKESKGQARQVTQTYRQRPPMRSERTHNAEYEWLAKVRLTGHVTRRLADYGLVSKNAFVECAPLATTKNWGRWGTPSQYGVAS